MNQVPMAVAMVLICISVIVIAIGMDIRKLPFGRIKYVPWTYITITAMLALMLAARNLLLVLTGRV